MSKKKSEKTPKAMEIVIVMDRSGSMASMRNDAIGGFNSFIDEQAKEPGECSVSLLLFDHEHDMVYEGVPVGEVQELTDETFVPRGNTALRDAIVRGAATLERRATKRKLGVLAILTDGEENASTEVSADDLKRSLADCESKGWGVIYLGANQDAVERGVQMGIKAANAATFTGDRVEAGIRSVSSNVTDFRSTGDAKALSFSPGQRSAMSSDSDEMVGSTAAAEILGISTSTLKRRTAAGTGPPAHDPGEGGHKRFRRGSLREYLDS